MSRHLPRAVPFALLAAGLALSGASLALPADAAPRVAAPPTAVSPVTAQPHVPGFRRRSLALAAQPPETTLADARCSTTGAKLPAAS